MEPVNPGQASQFRQYFHVGDRVLQLDYGKLIELPVDNAKVSPRQRPAAEDLTPLTASCAIAPQ